MILELWLWSQRNKQRDRIEELEARLEALEPPKPVEAEKPSRDQPGVFLILCVIILIIVIAAANSGPAETLIYVDGIPVPTPRPLP